MQCRHGRGASRAGFPGMPGSLSVYRSVAGLAPGRGVVGRQMDGRTSQCANDRDNSLGGEDTDPTDDDQRMSASVLLWPESYAVRWLACASRHYCGASPGAVVGGAVGVRGAVVVGPRHQPARGGRPRVQSARVGSQVRISTYTMSNRATTPSIPTLPTLSRRAVASARLHYTALHYSAHPPHRADTPLPRSVAGQPDVARAARPDVPRDARYAPPRRWRAVMVPLPPADAAVSHPTAP